MDAHGRTDEGRGVTTVERRGERVLAPSCCRKPAPGLLLRAAAVGGPPRIRTWDHLINSQEL